MAPTYWDPEWIELAKSLGPPPKIPEGETEEKRTFFSQFVVHMHSLLPPPPGTVTSEDHTLPGDLKIRTYKPTSSAPSLPRSHSCSSPTAEVSGPTISTPAFNWTQTAPALGNNVADQSKIVLWGGSAGGALVVALAYRRVQENRGNEVAGLVHMNGLALHPSATPKKYTHLMRSYEDNAGQLPFVSGHDTLRLYGFRDLIPSADKEVDIRLFPAAGGADAVKGFPATYIVTSDNDASRDDGTVLEAALKDAGVRVRRENVKGLAHYFWVFDLPMANERVSTECP